MRAVTDEGGDAGAEDLVANAIMNDPELAAAKQSLIDMQKNMLDIQTGKRQPPPWFKRTGFDTATVKCEGLGEFQLVAASSGTMERIELCEKPELELELWYKALVESIASMPADLKVRRPINAKNVTIPAGEYFENLWGKNIDVAVEIMKALIGGKLFKMLKHAINWISTLDMAAMMSVDPEKDPKTGNPPA